MCGVFGVVLPEGVNSEAASLASLGLFASVATMFFYVLQILMGRRN